MESIDVLTGQHVTIAYKPAGAFERGFSTILDWIIQFFYLMFLFVVAEEFNNAWNLPENVNITIFLIFFAPVAFYNFLFEGFMYGQTPGKMILKIKVTDADGSSVSIGRHFLRWLLRPIDFFPMMGGLGVFFIIFTKKQQRIGDLAADTVVVRTSGKIDIGAEYYDFDEDYTPVFQQVEELSEGQVRLIRSFLELPERGNEEKIEDLSAKVRKVLRIDTPIPDRDLLTQVVKDYNYYASLGI